MNRIGWIAVAGTLGLCPAASAQEVIFAHEVVKDDAKVGLGAYSGAEPRPNKNYRRADDFTLSEAATVGSVVWWGQSTADFADGLDNFTSFTIQFYESRVTGAGVLQPKLIPFSTTTIALEEITATPTGRAAPNGGLEHLFSATLPDAVELQADTIYFFSVAASYVDPAKDAFQWSDSEFDNGYGGSWSYERTKWEMLQDTDSAFRLLSVPAPGPAATIGMSVLLLARRAR